MLHKTPSIKRHKEAFKALEQRVAGHFGHRYSLTKTESKYREMSWQDGSASRTKGVESDLIVIFEDDSRVVEKIKTSRFNTKNIYDSFAFSFNRVSEDSDEMSVTYSTKINNEIRSSTPFSQDVFRDLLRAINRYFREEGVPKDRQTLLWRLNSFFMENKESGIQPYDQSDALNKVLGKDRDLIVSLNKRGREIQDHWMQTSAEISHLQSIIDQEAKTSPEALAITRLQNEIKALREKMAKKKKDEFKRRGGDKLVEQEKRYKADADAVSTKLMKTVESVNSRIPADPATKSGVRHWLEENS